MTGPPHFSPPPRPSVSIMPISPPKQMTPQNGPFPKIGCQAPQKASSTCYGQLGFQLGPLQRWPLMGGAFPKPSSPRATFLSFLGLGSICGRGDRGQGEGDTEKGHREGTQTGTDTGECKSLRPRKRLGGHSLGNKGPRGGRALHHCSLSLSLCSQHLLGVAPRSPRQKPTGSTMAPVGQGQAWLSSSPPSTSPFHLHHLQERWVRRWLRGKERRRRRGGGEI